MMETIQPNFNRHFFIIFNNIQCCLTGQVRIFHIQSSVYECVSIIRPIIRADPLSVLINSHMVNRQLECPSILLKHIINCNGIYARFTMCLSRAR